MTYKMDATHSYSLRCGAILLVIFIATYKIFSLAPIAQDPAYHQFADVLSYGGIPNIGNVISNAGFLIAGIVGLIRNRKNRSSFEVFMWDFFFAAVVGVGIGSAYYHWQPSNNSLFWDRLPMTLAFGSLVACICGERFGGRFGKQMFRFVVSVGAFSVVYWWVSEIMGAGDLRLYILIQYLPMVLLPLVLILFPAKASRDRMYWTLLLAYILAKLFELQDTAIFNSTLHMISGHSLKHLAAAAGILAVQPPCDSLNEQA